MNETEYMEISATKSAILYYENSSNPSALSQDTLYYIIMGASIMTLIICSFVCCLLIYGIITLKNTTKEMIQQRPRKASIKKIKSESAEEHQKKKKLKKQKSKICEVPHFSNPASDSCSNTLNEDKIGAHDRMISNDWKLTINDLHRLTFSNQASPSPISPIPAPITPIPNQINMDNVSIEIDRNSHEKLSKFNVNQQRNRIDDTTMIEKSISDQSERPWKYFSKYFQRSESKPRENDESEELDIVIGNENESTITKTIDNDNMNIPNIRSINIPNMNMMSITTDKLSIVNNINTMTNIGGIDEFTADSVIQSIDTGDDGELMLFKAYDEMSNTNTLFNGSMNRQPTAQTNEFSEEHITNNQQKRIYVV